MASISKQKNGLKTVQFVGADGRRRSIRLGKCTMKHAQEVKTRVEHIHAAMKAGLPLDSDTAGWLGEISDALAEKLAAVGLIPRREAKAVEELGEFITWYVGTRTDVKPATKEVWRQGENGLRKFFGKGKRLDSVTPGDADSYKLHLIGKGLAPMTVRKRLQFATMIFRAAMRQRLVSESPFADVSIKAAMPERGRFITQAETQRLLEACPNHHWRTIVALARFGGLRCPSEVLSLQWANVDWANSKIIVHAPKTEHHPGKGMRTIPLFPELRRVLVEAFELAEAGTAYVVDERMRASAQGKAGWRNCNLRTTFKKIVTRAGLEVWPRLFHNLRSSRQTELAEQFPSHVVCKWLGNSEDIAKQHYLQVTEDHFAKALAGPLRCGAESGAVAVQNAVQQPAAASGDESQPLPLTASSQASYAKSCDSREDSKHVFSGWGGIRTPGALRHNGFQDRRLRPLGHPSEA